MIHRRFLFPALMLMLFFTISSNSIAGEHWKAEINLRFGRPDSLFGGGIGLLELRIKNGNVSGTFRSSAGIKSTEIRVEGRLKGRLDPSATRQRISIQLKSLELEADVIELEGVVTRSGNRLKFAGRKAIWIEPSSGTAVPNHFVARLHWSDGSYSLPTPYPGESVESFLAFVETRFRESFQNVYPEAPFLWKVLIPTDENGFWSMPLTHHPTFGGSLRMSEPQSNQPNRAAPTGRFGGPGNEME